MTTSTDLDRRIGQVQKSLDIMLGRVDQGEQCQLDNSMRLISMEGSQEQILGRLARLVSAQQDLREELRDVNTTMRAILMAVGGRSEQGADDPS